MSVGTVRRPIAKLADGDRLDREEFHRRYLETPEHFRAELIEGVVHVSSPVSRIHGTPHGLVTGWLFNYRAATPGTDLAVDTTVQLDAINEPQPDVALFITPECGGQIRYTDDGYIEGAPELAIEIAASSASYDLGAKKTAYARNGIQEYLVWRTADEAIDWFILDQDTYESLTPDSASVIRSITFPGLWLDVPAMLRHDAAQVLVCLQQGLATSDHATFAARFRSA